MIDDDILLSIREAASILGYRHPNSIKKLIKKGILEYYLIPDSTKKMVKRSEILALAVAD